MDPIISPIMNVMFSSKDFKPNPIPVKPVIINPIYSVHDGVKISPDGAIITFHQS